MFNLHLKISMVPETRISSTYSDPTYCLVVNLKIKCIFSLLYSIVEKRNPKEHRNNLKITLRGQTIIDVIHFLRFLTPPSPLVTYFTKKAFGLMSPYGGSPLSPERVTSFMEGPLPHHIIIISCLLQFF